MPPSWSIAPTLACAAGDPGAAPNTSMRPASGAESPSSMEIVVVLPAPLGPSRASVWPRSTVRLRLSTASTGAEAPRDESTRTAQSAPLADGTRLGMWAPVAGG